MRIYLPLKNDILDHGDANSVWTNPYASSGGGLPLFKNVGGVDCAEFDGTNRLKLQNPALVQNLTTWTIQCWFYAYDISQSSPSRRVFSTYALGNTVNGSEVQAAIYDAKISIIDSIFSVLAINTWYQIYVTCDGANIEIYYDNQPKTTISRGTRSFNTGLCIGEELGNYGWSTGFKGCITQFQLSDKYNDTKLHLNLDRLIYIADNNEVWGMV